MVSLKRISDGVVKLMCRYSGFMCIVFMSSRQAFSGSISTAEAGTGSAETPAMDCKKGHTFG